MKHWSGTLYQKFTGSVLPAKSRSEIIQRFFTPDENDIISLDEAYRFLQNKWMEKVRHSKMKPHGQNGNKGQETDGATPASSDLKGKRKTSRKRPQKG